MSQEENQSDPRRPLRKPVILIGAPSGAGKTVLSQKIVAGALPLFPELCGSAPDETPVSYALRALPDNPPRDRILIIECSTYNFERLMRSDRWRRVAGLVRESEMVIHVNLDVPRGKVVRQYFLRIFTQPRRMNVFYRCLQVSKYWTTLIYMLTSELSRSKKAWYQFGNSLAREMPSRVAIACVEARDRLSCASGRSTRTVLNARFVKAADDRLRRRRYPHT